MTLKQLELTTAEGKRNVKVANLVRGQMYDKVMSVLSEAGFDVCRAANGEIAIATCVDANTGVTYYTRLAVSLSAKDLEAKTAPKAKAPVAEVTIPDLFE